MYFSLYDALGKGFANIGKTVSCGSFVRKCFSIPLAEMLLLAVVLNPSLSVSKWLFVARVSSKS